ncbi:hypothetical protein JHK84_051498 [Glycine max]|nr:hypothetical protein JHK84_051498 [Glycine max]
MVVVEVLAMVKLVMKDVQEEHLNATEMTLEEYEKVLEEKRKALQAQKTEARKVDIKEFASMQPLSNKKENDEIFIKLVRISGPTFALNL